MDFCTWNLYAYTSVNTLLWPHQPEMLVHETTLFGSPFKLRPILVRIFLDIQIMPYSCQNISGYSWMRLIADFAQSTKSFQNICANSWIWLQIGITIFAVIRTDKNATFHVKPLCITFQMTHYTCQYISGYSVWMPLILLDQQRPSRIFFANSWICLQYYHSGSHLDW